jgi:hypothetical protein
MHIGTLTLGRITQVPSKNYGQQSSFKNWKTFFVENFRAHFGEDTRLATNRCVALEAYRNHLRQKPTKNDSVGTAASVNREIGCLHLVFIKAVRWEMMERSLFDKRQESLVQEKH